jgi:rfaE bifunctional protein nucleotidyltransferase chain/domain
VARSMSKVVGATELDAHLAGLPRPLVFTNGCFDILHRGHVTYLELARNLGACLVVGVNTDASVRRQGKGITRPIIPLDDRMAILAALESIDLVTPFDEDTPLQLISLVKPDHLAKGGDWKPADIVGAAEVTAWGGQVHSIPFTYQRSTTELLRKIQESPMLTDSQPD